mgnify:CR=1 FL=1
MLVQVRNRCSDFDSYRAARVKSLFNAESGANFALDAELPIEEGDWRIGVIVGPSGSGKSSRSTLGQRSSVQSGTKSLSVCGSSPCGNSSMT